MLVPGDRVVFNFKTDQSNTDWGYRCVVIGHMPRNKTPRFPWSAHLEKTLCCLAGRFAASLISGKQLTEMEKMHSSLVQLPLMTGFDEKFVSIAIPNSLELSPESDPTGIFDAADAKEELLISTSTPAEIDFLQDFLAGKTGTEAASMAEWIANESFVLIESKFTVLK